MLINRTLEVYICDRCDEQAHSDSGTPLTGWLVLNAALIEAQTATIAYHLCPDCRALAGTFLAGEYVPADPDQIEQPYESLDYSDFVPGDFKNAPWECFLNNDGHVYGWKQADEGLTRYCRHCGLKWASVRRIEGVA